MKKCLDCSRQFDAIDWRCPGCGKEPAIVDGVPYFTEGAADAGFNPEFFPRLAELEAANFWFQSRNSLILWALRTCFPDARNLLEIGCGTGYVLSGIREARPELVLCGSENDPTGLSLAARRVTGVTWIRMDVRHIPFAEEFDVIGAFDVLEHVDQDEEALLQMFQACKPGGGIIVTVPQHRFMWSRMDVCACHKRRYVKRELTKKIERAGFAVCRATSFVSLLLPLMLLSRVLKRGDSLRFDPFAELRIAPPLNRVFGKIQRAERMLIERGLSLPFGGSLLICARRC